MAPHVRLNNDQSVSNPFVLYTEIAQSPDNSISQPQDSQISSLEGRFNSSTDEINENGCFAKFTEEINGNKVDCMCIFPNNETYIKLQSARDNLNTTMFTSSEICDIGYNL